MNTPGLITGARVRQLASNSVQPQREGSEQANAFSLPEAVQHALQQRLQTPAQAADDSLPAVRQAKHDPQSEPVPPPLAALMAVLLMPEKPAAVETLVQAALPERIANVIPPAQMMQMMQRLPAEGATPGQLAQQVRLAADTLPDIAAPGRPVDSPRPERSAALRHAVRDKQSPERSEPVSLASNTTFLADDARLLTEKMQPERVVSVDTRAARWGDALVHMLKENIHFQLGQQQQISTIRLDPPSLGKLEIAIQLDAGKLTVHIGASQADVCRALQQCGDALRAQLSQQNFMQVEVQVSPDGQSQSQSHSRQQRDGRQSSPQISTAVELDAEEVNLTSRDAVLIKV